MARRQAAEIDKEASKATALKLFQSRMSVRRISIEVKVNPSTISRWLAEELLDRLLKDSEEKTSREKAKREIKKIREAAALIDSTL